VGSEAYHMFESSPSYNANEQTLAGFNQINPETGQIYTKAERSPFYNGTAQRELGVKFGTPHQWSQRIDYMANQATGSYNALQIVLNKRFTSGLQFLTHYTWSHALGHESYQFLIGPKIGRGTATTTAAKPSSLLETMICLSAEISSSAPAYPAGSTRSSADSN
jgi:hypothetical protein